jgi:hypothetical protein
MYQESPKFDYIPLGDREWFFLLNKSVPEVTANTAYNNTASGKFSCFIVN